MTYDYEDIYGRFYRLVDDQSFFKLDEDYVYDLMRGWLHDAVANPIIRKIFSEISLDDEIMELSFTLSNSVDEFSDKEFVGSVFAQYMVIKWLTPKVESTINTAFILGGKEEKKIQSNYKTTIDRLDSLELKLRKFIRDYGYENNSYLSGGE